MTSFEFATATRVVFGNGAVERLRELSAGFGRRALVVTGRTIERAEPVMDRLRRNGVPFETHSIAGEPDTLMVEAGVDRARSAGCELVIGIGGGSVLDAAKAIAAILPQPGRLGEYLEIVGRGVPLSEPSLPCVAIPTTAGTGSEVTRNAVLTAVEHRVKVSLRGPQLFPRAAIVDPQLTRALPADVTTFTGLDALTQLVEPYVSARANPLTDAICADGIPRAARALRVAVREPEAHAAREQMSLASLLSGMALTNAGLGAVHGFAGVIGGRFGAPHGAICAALLPHVMAGNWRALNDRRAPSAQLRRFDDVARLLTGAPQARAQDGISWLGALVTDLEVPALRAYGVTTDDLDPIVERAASASSMKANPVSLTPQELREILSAAL